MKLIPLLSNTANMAKGLDAISVAGLLLFNRFHQPDIDLDGLEVRPRVLPSPPPGVAPADGLDRHPYGRIQTNLAATSEVYSPEDVVKLFMVGADVTGPAPPCCATESIICTA